MFLSRTEHRIALMARVLQVSVSGYYKWLERQQCPLTRKEQEDEALTKEIRQILSKSRGSFGFRKITKVLNKGREQAVNHKRVLRLMRQTGLFSKVPKKKYVTTTQSSDEQKHAPNLLNRDLSTTRSSEKMVRDTTYIPACGKTIYAAMILDLFGRRPLGLAMSLMDWLH